MFSFFHFGLLTAFMKVTLSIPASSRAEAWVYDEPGTEGHEEAAPFGLFFCADERILQMVILYLFCVYKSGCVIHERVKNSVFVTRGHY